MDFFNIFIQIIIIGIIAILISYIYNYAINTVGNTYEDWEKFFIKLLDDGNDKLNKMMEKKE